MSSDASPPWLILYGSERCTSLTLAAAIVRASAQFGASHVVIPVLEQDEPWWRRLLVDHPETNIVVQYVDRGSGMAVLAAFLRILRREPGCSVIIAPVGASHVPTRAGSAQPSCVVVASSRGPIVTGASAHVLERFRDAAPAAVSSLSTGEDLGATYPHLSAFDLDQVFGALEPVVDASRA